MTDAPDKGEVLLLGGNSLANHLASMLLDDGWNVLLSLATDLKAGIPPRPGLRVRRGRLNREGLASLLADGGFFALVDASHPYAEELRRMAPEAARAAAVPYLSLLRPATTLPGEMPVHMVQTHAEAASLAAGRGLTILSTIGVNKLRPYLESARAAKVRLVARVLPESAARCAELGLADNEVIAARGPFTVDDNLRHLRESRAGTLVLKDGGEAGGTPEKLAAAAESGVAAIIVRRPNYPGTHLDNPEKLVAFLNALPNQR
ncbi:MAG: precorrin-6A reductase [Planctomycetota bacterium]|nr:precorrin-6A reductase [Planctomycetota bacterium]